MTETLSNTANHQRTAEMFVHLTPLGARVPYSISLDNMRNIWVATKGGLFKMDRFGELLYQEKNDFTKKAEPFCQVSFCEDKIIYAYSEYMSGLTLLKVMTLDGETISEQFVDGKIQSLSVNDSGEMFLTKRVKGEDSIVYSSDICCPSCWNEVICEDEYVFQTVCALPSDLLVVSTCTLPLNMYSRQFLRLINITEGKVIKSFSKEGKEDGQIFFPLSIQKYGSDILVLDKTGRIQQFTQDGEFVRVATKIDAYLGNAFVVDGDMALIACSGIVLDKDNQTICDDWLEKVPLDGSKWLPDPFVDKKEPSVIHKSQVSDEDNKK
ncbi:Hypothetical 36.0 kDa protein C45G9.5 in chromosome III, putative [Brugia malayi]|uniref:Hypothetical 36.0 kDa protein C45G9.5 in chromosome III, putative n=1 Tax=Brugia malayi TaxID=6279 RepID=A0A4E9FN90_BRUMA|nr:putative 36.0 kDa protein C45G9.5 in chromosome III, putative [Brugia malayi]VIO98014.1 Hypothetical 36.0 kDa protein C45G9.5 in chromosome III, putative [Brugia malayi]